MPPCTGSRFSMPSATSAVTPSRASAAVTIFQAVLRSASPRTVQGTPRWSAVTVTTVFAAGRAATVTNSCSASV